jgi:ubiquitin-conjugating enzyme E2 J1
MSRFSTSSPAVRRIMKEIAEIEANPSESFVAVALEENLFEWHFTLFPPDDSDFAGGRFLSNSQGFCPLLVLIFTLILIYRFHGKISLPTDYPFKAPDIVMFTPNGRFELNKKICLSVTGFHQETWSPSWNGTYSHLLSCMFACFKSVSQFESCVAVRTILSALIAFMPTKGNGAIGALDYSPEERRGVSVALTNDSLFNFYNDCNFYFFAALAKQSHSWSCEQCGAKMSETVPRLTAPSKPLPIATTPESLPAASVPFSPLASPPAAALLKFGASASSPMLSPLPPAVLSTASTQSVSSTDTTASADTSSGAPSPASPIPESTSTLRQRTAANTETPVSAQAPAAIAAAAAAAAADIQHAANEAARPLNDDAQPIAAPTSFASMLTVLLFILFVILCMRKLLGWWPRY